MISHWRSLIPIGWLDSLTILVDRKHVVTWVLLMSGVMEHHHFIIQWWVNILIQNFFFGLLAGLCLWNYISCWKRCWLRHMYSLNFFPQAISLALTVSLALLLLWASLAQAYCRTNHTDLASALDSSDQDMIGHIWNIQGDSWIGLYRDTWRWSDGTIATHISWAHGQPDNYAGYENCAMAYNRWFSDTHCTRLYYIFCQTSESFFCFVFIWLMKTQ